MKRRLPGLVAGALIAAVVLGLAVWTLVGDDDDPPPASDGSARSAERFLDSVGVNVHVTYLDTTYGRPERWMPLLRELGVRHVRDGLFPGNQQAIDALLALERQGQRATLIAGDVARPAQDSVRDAVGPLRPALAALEAPNEADNFIGEPEWEPTLRRFVPELSRAWERARAPVPLVGPSFVRPQSRDRVADLRPLWAQTNVHPYPGGREPSVNLAPDVLGPKGAAGKPIQATETGYHNARRSTEARGQLGVPEEVSAAYLPRMVAEYFAAGVERTFLYELLDERDEPQEEDPEQHFGLVRADYSRKPAFESLRNTLRAVRRSPGEGERPPAEVDGGPPDVQRLLLDRADGSRVLLLWRRVQLYDLAARTATAVGPVGVRVRFPEGAEDVEVVRPGRSDRPERVVGGVDEGGEAEVRLAGDLVAVSFR